MSHHSRFAKIDQKHFTEKILYRFIEFADSLSRPTHMYVCFSPSHHVTRGLGLWGGHEAALTQRGAEADWLNGILPNLWNAELGLSGLTGGGGQARRSAGTEAGARPAQCSFPHWFLTFDQIFNPDERRTSCFHAHSVSLNKNKHFWAYFWLGISKFDKAKHLLLKMENEGKDNSKLQLQLESQKLLQKGAKYHISSCFKWGSGQWNLTWLLPLTYLLHFNN